MAKTSVPPPPISLFCDATLDLLQHIEPRLFITFPNGDALNPSNERYEWGTITFCPPVPVSLLDQLREGKHITATVSCTGQSGADHVTLTYYQGWSGLHPAWWLTIAAVNEYLLLEACPGLMALQCVLNSGTVADGDKPDLRKAIAALLPVAGHVGRSAAHVPEQHANALVPMLPVKCTTITNGR